MKSFNEAQEDSLLYMSCMRKYDNIKPISIIVRLPETQQQNKYEAKTYSYYFESHKTQTHCTGMTEQSMYS